MGKIVRVAAAQMAPVFLEQRACVDKVCAAIREAGASGAQLVAFPEACVPGYPYWALVLDPLRINDFNLRLYKEAVTIPGPATEVLCAAAREARCHAVVGVNERDGGTLYNTQLFLGPEGELLGRHRKLMPTSHERMIWGRGDGSDLRVFRTPLGTLGGLICYEHANALYRYALQAQGEEIHIAAWLGGLPSINDIIDAAVRHYAFEAQAFVINVTGILTADIIAALGEGGSVDQLQPGGGFSSIIAPGGRYLARAEPEREMLLYADLDFDAIADWKMIVDSCGHYARPDVVRLVLESRPQRSLHIED
ncbi:MAG TPA: carbon-nitrogen hydrolase family protein [Candidatus Competibacteraceae bacterium]|nr:carbon-nitrogen hydrolase family protein [Candidatus Competibacteraceae bacterium]